MNSCPSKLQRSLEKLIFYLNGKLLFKNKMNVKSSLNFNLKNYFFTGLHCSKFSLSIYFSSFIDQLHNMLEALVKVQITHFCNKSRNIRAILSSFLLKLNDIVIRKQLTMNFSFTTINNHTTREFEEKIIFSREPLIKYRSGKTLKSVRKNINKKHMSAIEY